MEPTIISLPCDACGSLITGSGPDGFGDAYVAHVRADHSDWRYSEKAVRRYAAQHLEREYHSGRRG